MEKSSIAICIPTYNQAQYIVETLDSLLKQELVPDEVWICDDCSTDNTAEVIEAYLERFNKLYYFKNEHNLGLSQNIYQLLRKPTTDYIVMLHSDDVLYPNYLRDLSSLLDAFPKAGVAHCNIQEMDEYSRPTKQRLLNRSTTFQDPDSALKASPKGYKVAANVVMYRKAALDSIHLPDDWPNFVEDYNIFVRLAAADWGNVFSPEILGSYRVWIDQKGMRSKRKEAELNGYIRLFDEVLEPAFQNRGWDRASLRKQRKRLALSHTIYLSEVELDAEAKQRIIKLLKTLGSSSSLDRRIRFHTSRIPVIRKLLLFKYNSEVKLKGLLKQNYLTLVPRKMI